LQNAFGTAARHEHRKIPLCQRPRAAVATVSKRKEPEGAAPAAAGPPLPPPRLGDHAAYMPEGLLALADVHVKVRGGLALPAHAVTLVQHCRVLARSSELFVGASPERPAALSSPFDEYAEADVAHFLRCVYTAVRLHRGGRARGRRPLAAGGRAAGARARRRGGPGRGAAAPRQ
jgi:hypothetical protein